MKKPIHYCIQGCPYLTDKAVCKMYGKTVTIEKETGKPRKIFNCYMTSIKQLKSTLDAKVSNIMEQVFGSRNILNSLDVDELKDPALERLSIFVGRITEELKDYYNDDSIAEIIKETPTKEISDNVIDFKNVANSVDNEI